MMHADLIDQDDFRDRLVALGFEIPSGATAEQACERAVVGLSRERCNAAMVAGFLLPSSGRGISATTCADCWPERSSRGGMPKNSR